MSKIKRIVAVISALALVFTLAACRTKDEVAMTFTADGQSFQMTSALYLCYLIEQDVEFKNQVYDALTDEEKNSGTTIDYTAKKLEDKDYTTWITEHALTACKSHAYNEIYFDKLGLSFDADELNEIYTNCDNYWTSQGYSQTYEPNGVAYSTYKAYFLNSYKNKEIFTYYYGEKSDKDKNQGSKRPSEDVIKKGLQDNFALADAITVAFTDQNTGTALTDTQKADKLKQLKGYAEELKKGASFQSVYVKFYGSDKEASTTKSESGLTAKDKYASLFFGPITGSESDFYSDVKKMTVGDIKVLESSTGYLLAVRKDIMDDPYYLETGTDTVIQVLKSDEFDEFIEKQAETLTISRNESAMGYYVPTKLRYPAQEAAASSAAAAAAAASTVA